VFGDTPVFGDTQPGPPGGDMQQPVAQLILSSTFDHALDLRGCDTDSVVDVGLRAPCSVGSNNSAGFLLRRVAFDGLAEDVGCPAFPQSLGQGLAEVSVVLLQASDALGGGLEPAQ
jgi:hypothetical protein